MKEIINSFNVISFLVNIGKFCSIMEDILCYIDSFQSCESVIDAFACRICLDSLKKLENLQNEIINNTPPVKAECNIVNNSLVEQLASVSNISVKVETNTDADVSMTKENDNGNLEEKQALKIENDAETAIKYVYHNNNTVNFFSISPFE